MTRQPPGSTPLSMGRQLALLQYCETHHMGLEKLTKSITICIETSQKVLQKTQSKCWETFRDDLDDGG